MSFDIDIAIIVVFLTATMAVGLLAGRKVTNIRDYALGNRSFTTSALVATMVSTTISGSAFYIILSKTYSGGWFLSVAVSGIAFGKLFTAFYLLPKMGEFLGKTSIAEAMGDMYGISLFSLRHSVIFASISLLFQEIMRFILPLV